MAFPLYTWDPRLQRYRSKRTGQLVPQAAVRRALDAALENEKRRSRALADQYRRGELTVRGFRLGMADMVKRTQLFSLAAGKGGWGQLTAADYGFVGAKVREQYAFLDNFADEIRAGLPLDGRFLNRAEQYARAGKPTFDQAEQETRLAGGDRRYRNVLHPAEHCDQCLAVTGTALGGTGDALPDDAREQGWVPIGSLPGHGQRTCRANDQCSFEYAA